MNRKNGSNGPSSVSGVITGFVFMLAVIGAVILFNDLSRLSGRVAKLEANQDSIIYILQTQTNTLKSVAEDIVDLNARKQDKRGK